MKKSWIVAIAVVLLAGAGVAVWQHQSAKADAASAAALVAPAAAEPALPPPAAPVFKDTSMLRAPAGAPVAIYEFDDLECPSCAHALPILHTAQARYQIPLVHHDYPLTEIHIWSFDAAVTARYLQDKVSPAAGDAFRRDVFAHQTEIADKDDLARFTKEWFKANGQTMPFVMDPGGIFKREVQADRALGDRIGIKGTPTVFVVTQQNWQQVSDLNQLSRAIEGALAQPRS